MQNAEMGICSIGKDPASSDQVFTNIVSTCRYCIRTVFLIDCTLISVFCTQPPREVEYRIQKWAFTVLVKTRPYLTYKENLGLLAQEGSSLFK